jgi:hypothetical protein
VLTGGGTTLSSLRVTVPAGTPTGTYRVVVRATDGVRIRSVAVRVAVDGDLPAMPTPRVGAPVGSRFNTTYFSVHGLWSPATDPTSAIVRYQAQWRVDSGAWGPTITVPASVPRTPRTFVVGHRYQLRVRASDSAGNWSAWSMAPAFTAEVVQDSSSSLLRTGTWRRYTNTSMSGGTSRYATARGASITRKFVGRAVSIVAPMSRSRGRVQVWVDGVLVKTADLYRSTISYRRVVCTRTWSVSGTHTVRLVVLGTAGRPRVDLDAILILR